MSTHCTLGTQHYFMVCINTPAAGMVYFLELQTGHHEECSLQSNGFGLFWFLVVELFKEISEPALKPADLSDKQNNLYVNIFNIFCGDLCLFLKSFLSLPLSLCCSMKPF